VLAARLSGSAADGEDLVHDVLERFARRWPQVAALDNVDAYTRRALINLNGSPPILTRHAPP